MLPVLLLEVSDGLSGLANVLMSVLPKHGKQKVGRFSSLVDEGIGKERDSRVEHEWFYRDQNKTGSVIEGLLSGDRLL